MEAIAQGFQWLIDTITQIWEFFMSMLSGIMLAFRYLFVIMELAIKTIGNLPDWLQAFGIITISITVMYFVIGREAGKTE